MTHNDYVPVLSEIKEIVRHTENEWTFRMTWNGPVKPSQFFELSLPKYGEAPISVSGIEPGLIDFTIRKIGHVTTEIFNYKPVFDSKHIKKERETPMNQRSSRSFVMFPA